MLSPYRVEDASPYQMTTAIVSSPLPTPGEIKRDGSPHPHPDTRGGPTLETPGGGDSELGLPENSTPYTIYLNALERGYPGGYDL